MMCKASRSLKNKNTMLLGKRGRKILQGIHYKHVLRNVVKGSGEQDMPVLNQSNTYNLKLVLMAHTIAIC